jgi:hypothetical protein
MTKARLSILDDALNTREQVKLLRSFTSSRIGKDKGLALKACLISLQR